MAPGDVPFIFEAHLDTSQGIVYLPDRWDETRRRTRWAVA